MKVMRKNLICLLVGTLLLGCVSRRFTTDMNRSIQRKPCPFRFNISELYYMPPKEKDFFWGYPSSFVTEGYFFQILNNKACIKASTEDIRKILQEKAEQRYPDLFSNAVDALPLHIRCKVQRSSSWLVSYLLQPLTLGQIPLPFSEEAHFRIQVYLQGESVTNQHEIGEIRFSRRDFGWMSLFSPIGLTKIPGETAKPKTSGIMFDKQARQRGGELTIESIIDSINVILQLRDLTPEIEKYIKSQRKF